MLLFPSQSTALDVEGKGGRNSDSGLSFEPTRPSSQSVRNTDIIDSHWVATADACVLADELQVPASGNDEPNCQMTGSPLSNAVGCGFSPLSELLSSSRLSASSAERVEHQSDHSKVLRTPQVPIDVSDKNAGVPEPCYRLDPTFEGSFDPSWVDQRHMDEIDAPPWASNIISPPGSCPPLAR